MSTLFAGYDALEGTFDEMFEPSSADATRPGYDVVHQRLSELNPAEVRARAEFLAHTYTEQGVTFDIGGEERPFPLDLVPRLVDAASWATVEIGVAQRVRALERFLDDVYGPGDAFAAGVIPRSVVTTSPHFHRVVAGLTPPNGVRIHVAGIDLVRDGAVIADTSVQAARARHHASREELPASARQLQKGEPVIPTVYLGGAS